MYEKPFNLDIIAPDRLVYRGQATSVTAPGVLGAFQVLFNHAPLLAQLAPGPLKVMDTAGAVSLFAVGGGFAEVRDNQVTVLADSAEKAGEIDIERAQKAARGAGDRLREHLPDDELTREALARALNRLKVATKQ